MATTCPSEMCAACGARPQQETSFHDLCTSCFARSSTWAPTAVELWHNGYKNRPGSILVALRRITLFRYTEITYDDVRRALAQAGLMEPLTDGFDMFGRGEDARKRRSARG